MFKLPDSFWNMMARVFMPRNFNVIYVGLVVGFVFGAFAFIFVVHHSAPEDADILGMISGFVVAIVSAHVVLAIYNFFDRCLPTVWKKLKKTSEKKTVGNIIDLTVNEKNHVSMAAEVLKCPVCGRPKNQNSSRCKKCGYQY